MDRPSENLRDGERRFVTVVFADMKEFSALTQRMDPEELDGLMSTVFGRFESVVHHYEGNVEKYIGDAMVAVFGAPAIHEDDPARAVNAALEFIDQVGALNETLRDREIHLEFRVGVNTGLITTGRRGQYEVVTGHAMTVASRLESAAGTNTVLASEATRIRCADEFVFGEPITVNAKGHDGPLRAYPVTGHVRRPHGEDAIFVGRESILESITKRYLRHDPARTDGVILTGEAGIGKSRTVARFFEQVQQFPNFNSPILYARAQRYRNRPFAVVSDSLFGYFGVSMEAPINQVVAAVTHRLEIEHATAESFARLLSGDQRGPENQAFVLLYLVLKSIIATTGDSPFSALLVVDNLSFMDRHSRDFFRFFLKNADTKPFLLLTDRRLQHSDADVFSELETTDLQPLQRPDAEDLIRRLWPDAPSDAVVGKIQKSAQGNPLFIREYVRFAREKPADQALPTTIQTIFLTAVDSLPTDRRDLLKRVSVFAQSFSNDDARYLQERTEGDPAIVDQALADFLADDTLVKDGDQFAFRNDVFKQALYDSLLNHNKRVLHRVIAELMQAKSTPQPLRLLHHLTRAEDYEAARTALQKSPQLVTNLDYMRYIDRLLEHTSRDNHGPYIHLLFVKAALLFNNGHSDDADSLLKEILRIAIEQQNTIFAASAYHLVTANNLKSNSFEKAEYSGRKALECYGSDEGFALRRQNVLEIVASAAVLRNDPDAADAALAEIERMITEDGTGKREPFGLARAERCLMQGEYERARRMLSELGPPDQADYRYLQLLLGSIAAFHLCDWEELLRIDREVLAEHSRHAANLAQINAHIAVATHFTGDRKRAADYLQQAEFNTSQIRNDFDALDAHRTVAECCHLMGQTDRAVRIATEAATIGLRHSATYSVFTLLMLLVEIRQAYGDTEPAQFFLREAGFLIDRGYLVRNRDAMLYHYYRWQLDPAMTQARTAAAGCLTTEFDRIAAPNLIRAFLNTRRFGRIADELGVTVARAT